MTLTIPQAGPIAGRAAQIRVEAPETGAILAQAGQVAQQIGSRMEADRLDRQAQKLQLDATRELGQMRLEFEQNTDPDAIDTLWPQRVAELKDRYLKGRDENGMARVDPRIADRFGMAVTELADRHAFALGSRAIDLRRAQREAIWIGQRQEIVTQGATTDQGTLEKLLADGDAAIEARAVANAMDAAEVAREKAEMRYSVFSQRANILIDSDPEAFLAQAGPGSAMANALGEDVTAMRLAAQNERAKRAAIDQKNAEAAAKEAAAARDARVKKIGDIWDQGRTPADAAYLDTPEAKESPYWAETRAKADLQAEMPGIKLMTVDQLDDIIAAEQNRPAENEWDNQRLTALRGWRDAAAAGWNTAPVETARAAGLAVPAMRPFDADRPQDFAEDLGRAVLFQKAVLHDGGYTQAPAVFDKPTQAQLTAVLAPEADPEQKLSLVTAIVQGAGANRESVLNQLNAAPEVQRVAALLATSPAAYRGLADDALKGQQKLALKTVQVPSARVSGLMFDDVTGGALAGLSETKVRQVIDLANALYANDAKGVDPDATDTGYTAWLTDPARVELYRSAILRATGALAGDVGGVQTVEVAGMVSGTQYTVALPPGQAAAPVSGALTALSLSLKGMTYDEARARNRYDKPSGVPEAFAMTALKRASIDGRVPDFGDDPGSYFDNLRIQRIEDSNVYRFVDVSSGRPQIVGDANGLEYRFRLPDLIRHTKGGPK